LVRLLHPSQSQRTRRGGGRRLRRRQSAVRARCPTSRLTAAQMLRTRLLATVAAAAHHPTARPPARSAEIQRPPGRRWPVPV